VRALDERIELRMWTKTEEAVLVSVARTMEGGLNLTGPFYNLLPQFESSDLSFDKIVPALLAALPRYAAK
jgi:hypothetical protein